MRECDNDSGDDLLDPARVKLLIIESNDLFRRIISERLRLENYLVFETHQEAEAREMVTDVDIDVVLLGLVGFKREGLSLLKAIKAIRPHTEVILMTSSEDLALSIEGMKLGAFDDLLLPFDMDSLLDRIRAAKCQREKRSKEEQENAKVKGRNK